MTSFLDKATRSTTRLTLQHKVTTRAIRDQLHDLTTQLQLMLSHSEELRGGTSKVQQAHVKAIRDAMKQAVKIIGKMQNLAAIELDEHES